MQPTSMQPTLSKAPPPFSKITESPGQGATTEQLERMYQRYRFAREYAAVDSILEAACGTGIGLGYLSDCARQVAGFDIDADNCDIARAVYAGEPRITVKNLDAHSLEYPDATFDTALLFDALYYLQDPDSALAELKRVLKPDGTLILSQVNPGWSDFHPSPYTYRYFSAPDLALLLQKQFPTVELYGGFAVDIHGWKPKLHSLVKRTAVRFNLIPGSLKMRAYLKRLVYGQLRPLPERVVESMAAYTPPVGIPLAEPDQRHKILYAVAHAAEGHSSLLNTQ